MPYFPPVRVRLAEIISTVKPVYPEPRTWDATVEYIQNDPCEKEILDELLGVLGRGDAFNSPIAVGKGNDDDGTEAFFVFNGTHRMVAHIAHGSEFIDVAYENEDENAVSESDEDSYRILETVIEFAEDVDDDTSDMLFSVLRSFPMSDDLWLESGVMSGHLNHFECMWNITEADDQLIAAINQKCIDRINHYLSVAPSSVKTAFYEFDDAD